MRLLDQVHHVIRKNHYSILTEQVYTDWVDMWSPIRSDRFAEGDLFHCLGDLYIASEKLVHY